MHWPILFLSLFILASCGKSNTNAGVPLGSNPQIFPTNNDVVSRKRYFLAKLVAINPELTGDVSGKLAVEQTGYTFKGALSLSTAEWHEDNIHDGFRCPTKADDVNGDMVVDAGEAEAVAGNKLIPLSESGNSAFTGAFDLNGKVVLINGATEAMACGILKTVSSLPDDTNYEPQPNPVPNPAPTPQPSPNPAPEREDDEDDETWIDRFNEWWRCRLGGCD